MKPRATTDTQVDDELRAMQTIVDLDERYGR